MSIEVPVFGENDCVQVVLIRGTYASVGLVANISGLGEDVLIEGVAACAAQLVGQLRSLMLKDKLNPIRSDPANHAQSPTESPAESVPSMQPDSIQSLDSLENPEIESPHAHEVDHERGE